MRKSISLAALALLLSLTALAGPAKPGRIDYIQPDGSVIAIYLHGDEFYHWATDESGTVLMQDENGYWKTSNFNRSTLSALQEEAAARRAEANETRREYAQSAASTNFGSPKIPVILVGFSGNGEQFSKTNAQFSAMLNSAGYSDNNAIGSVLDYFNENSLGQFTPQFEVLGPVTLDNNKSYYGGNNSAGNDKLPELALVHAAKKLDSTVDFSRYDNDGDGTVDFVLFYFAGYDEAQGGNANCIWSHAWYLSSSSNVTTTDRTFDKVKLNRYFCTSELKGSSGSTMCSIGTTCHEFAHTLGLPDFYDADYSTNGSAANMYDFDLMASGPYNANSTTPPYMTAEEAYEVGWLASIPELTSTGSVTLQGVNYPGATSYSAYMTRTAVSGEYFVYECRRGERWDAPLPTGMMVYHVDKSSNRVSGSVTASSTWSSNSVNNYSSHPCCYVVPAANPTSTSVYSGSASNFFFPGGRSVRSYSPTAWSGSTIGFQLTNITYSNKVVTFDLVNSNVLGISGMVVDSDGNPLEGASIAITTEERVSNVVSRGNSLLNKVGMLLKPSAKRMNAIRKAAIATLVTDAEGCYSIELEAGTYQVTASKSGYVSQSASVAVTSRIETQNFYLMREGEEVPSELYAWPTDILTEEDEYIVGSSNTALTGQNLYPASELTAYAGKQIKSITFYLYGDPAATTYKGVNAIIDFDDQRAATVAVPTDDVTVGGYTTVDLRDLELIIPSGKDLYAGVGYSSGGYSYNGYYYSFGAFYKTGEDEDGNEFTYDWAVDWPYDGLVSEYNLTATGTRYSWDVLFDIVLTVGDYNPSDSGYNFIEDPQGGQYSAGDVLPLNLILTGENRKPAGAVSWFFDDEPVSGTSVTLPSGTHVVEARFTTAAGTRKVVELELEVN